jgi:hypothetical protein
LTFTSRARKKDQNSNMKKRAINGNLEVHKEIERRKRGGNEQVR